VLFYTLRESSMCKQSYLLMIHFNDTLSNSDRTASNVCIIVKGMRKDVEGSVLRVNYVNVPAFSWSDGVKLR
jgi:hypothetical protein